MRLLVISFSVLLCAAGEAATCTVPQLRDEVARFSPAAALRAVEDLARHPSYAAARHRAAVEALAKRRDWVKAHLVENDPASAEAAALVEGYRQAMLANPCLDPDRILCVRRIVANPVWPNEYDAPGGSDTPCGPARARSRNLGLLGLNAHNHMDLRRNGFTNEIAILSNLRGTNVWTSVYRPARTEIVRDLDLDFDASRILFTSYRGTNNLLGVYEVEPSGRAAPQLVSPARPLDVQWWDGCYLPDRNQVILLGTGAWQFLPCEEGNYPMCVLFRLDRRTGEVTQLTFEQDSDYTPEVLNDGRVVYTRWEYSDIQHYFSRELMTMNPDGTGQLALWGSGSYFPTFFSGTRPVPDDPHRLVLMASGHHGRAEHGRMLLLDPSLARKYPFRAEAPDRTWGPPLHTLRIPTETLPARETGFVHEFPGYGRNVEGDVSDLQADNQHARGRPYFAHPWPLGGAYFLASAKTSNAGRFGLYLVDAFDNMVLLAEEPEGALFEPILLAPRKRPPVLPDRRVKGAKTCSVHIADIYAGEGLKGVPRGTVKRLRVFEYHYCYHKTGGHVSLGLDKVEAGWDIKRVLGTVAVEPDGSCSFEMPANAPVSFQPLDADGAAVQLMRSWTVGMPGERVSCTGCHEDNRSSVPTKRTATDAKFHAGQLQRIVPPDADGVRPWGFAPEFFPHVQASCLSCHGTGSPRDCSTPERAYRALHPFIRRGGAESELQVLTPYEFHASTSPLVQMLKKGHHGARLSDEGWRQLYTWIDLNCPFYGKWDPPAYRTDGFVAGCTNQVARRNALRRAYADRTEDFEAEYDRHAARVRARGPLPVVPPLAEKPRPPAPHVAGWPMDVLARADAQLGRIDEVAPVTTRTLILSPGEHMTFRRIPAGTYVMGSTNGAPDEACRVVRIAKPFWLGEMEVENSQYHAFDPAHDSRAQDQYGYDQVMPGHVGNHRRQPVVRVSREEAEAFCRWLAETCGVVARLPSEEEWEWAARAGTETPFPWGGLDDDFGPWANLADCDVRWMYSAWDHAGCVQTRRPYPPELNYPLHEPRWRDDWFTLNFTGRARANPWGLYDMHGNAAEWTCSTTPNGRAVVRGGSFASRPRDATSSVRQTYLPHQRVFDIGFRVLVE